MSEKTDIVYVLGDGSKWANRELWFSLASVAKNLKDVGRIFVVGSNPGFLSKEVTFIPVREQYDPKLNPAANIITKLLAVCKGGVSEKFLLFNDDFVVLKPISANDVPVVHKGKFSDYPQKYFNSGNYRLRMRKTFSILKQRKLPDYNFGVHIPFPMERKKLLHLLNNVDWKSGVGISLRTIYGNMYYSKAEMEQVKDPNLNEHYSLAKIQARFSTEHFMSYNDRGLNRPLKMFLKQQFPSEHPYANGPLPKLPIRQALHKRLA
jgi:hypothetical protein